MSKIYLSILIIVVLVLAIWAGAFLWQNGYLNNDDLNNNNLNNNNNNTIVPINKVLNLSGQGLNSIPNYVFSQTNLEELNVSNNNLTGAIQSQIGQLKNLKVLNASNNKMTGVPAEVGQLSKLEILDLSNNQLTGLPNELGNLQNLKTLNLSGNNYSEQDLNNIRSKLPITTDIITN